MTIHIKIIVNATAGEIRVVRQYEGVSARRIYDLELGTIQALLPSQCAQIRTGAPDDAQRANYFGLVGAIADRLKEILEKLDHTVSLTEL